MSAFHEPTWRKAGIFEAVVASTLKICKDSDLVLGIAEKWCPDTKTFVFPWGEATITLEDVMLLLGFSVLGSPVFASLDSSGEETKEKVEKEWFKIKREKLGFVTQALWIKRFMNSGGDDELEHVAFLALWLSYFVFPSSYYHIPRDVLSIAVQLSRGTRMAFAPAVLAHLYAELTLLKDHIGRFTQARDTEKLESTSLFKLVQVWTWERFKELRPKPNRVLKGEPRLTLWNDLRQPRTRDHVRQILENSSMDCFEWRPYTKTVKNWQFPKFYPEKEMWVPVGPDLDDEFISFARCFKVSDLVGTDCVEHYFPNRVASQFGFLQDVPCPVNRNNLSKKEAWDEYNKPIEDLTLFIPSRAAIPRLTSMFCEWWRKWFPQLHHSLKEKGVGDAYDDTYTSDSKRQKLFHENNESSVVSSHNDEGDESSLKAAKVNDEKFGVGDASEPLCKKCRLEADDNCCSGLASVRADVDKADREQRKETDVTGSKAGKRIVLSPCDERNPSHPPSALGGAMGIVVSPVETTKPCDDELDVCGSNVEKMTMIDYVTKETEFSLHNDDSLIQIKQRNEGNDETGSRTGKDMDMSANDENITSDPPLGFDDATQDILVSPPPETRKTCDDELDVHGRNVEKMSMPNDGKKEPESLLHEGGGMAEEKASSEKKEDESLIQTEIASNADNNEPTPCQNLAPGGSEVAGESNKGKAVGDETQGHDCLFHDTVLGSEETMKSSEKLEKRKEDVGGGNDSYEKSLHNVKELASSIEKLALSIDERIAKAERNVAWLKARKAAKLKKIAAVAARLI